MLICYSVGARIYTRYNLTATRGSGGWREIVKTKDNRNPRSVDHEKKK